MNPHAELNDRTLRDPQERGRRKKPKPEVFPYERKSSNRALLIETRPQSPHPSLDPERKTHATQGRFDAESNKPKDPRKTSGHDLRLRPIPRQNHLDRHPSLKVLNPARNPQSPSRQPNAHIRIRTIDEIIHNNNRILRPESIQSIRSDPRQGMHIQRSLRNTTDSS